MLTLLNFCIQLRINHLFEAEVSPEKYTTFMRDKLFDF